MANMTPLKLIVARHGNTFGKGDVIRRVGARTDLPLTSEGREQGRQLGLMLAGLGLTPSAVICSPLLRARETAEAALEAMGVELPVQHEDFLNEFDYGEDDGRPETDVVLSIGADQARADGIDPSELASDELTERGKRALKRWDSENALPERWRFMQPQVDRVVECWREFAGALEQTSAAGTIPFPIFVLAVTSNGVARFSTAILPEDAERPENMKLSTGAFGVYALDESGWRLEGWNLK